MTAAVNPPQRLYVQVSAGNVVQPDGTPLPVYRRAVIAYGDVQSLTYQDMQKMDGLNIEGTRRAIYFRGNVEGLVRVKDKGGDLVTDRDGNVWLVAQVLEHWVGWCKVAVTLQDGS